MSKKPLSETQAATLERISDGEVHRSNQIVDHDCVFNRRTLKALADRGLIEFSDTIRFKITDAGRAALKDYLASKELTEEINQIRAKRISLEAPGKPLYRAKGFTIAEPGDEDTSCKFCGKPPYTVMEVQEHDEADLIVIPMCDSCQASITIILSCDLAASLGLEETPQGVAEMFSTLDWVNVDDGGGDSA